MKHIITKKSVNFIELSKFVKIAIIQKNINLVYHANTLGYNDFNKIIYLWGRNVDNFMNNLNKMKNYQQAAKGVAASENIELFSHIYFFNRVIILIISSFMYIWKCRYV